MSTLNERIKSRRLSLNLTLLELADFLHIRESTMQRYESGQIKNIKYETVGSLSIILKCHPSYLMGWCDSLAGTTGSIAINKEKTYNFQFSDLEKQIIEKYRDADDFDKTTILRTLRIVEKGETEKMA